MGKNDLPNKFQRVNIWKKNGQRAPHKPLLILLAIDKLINSNIEDLYYREIEKELKTLLDIYGPNRKRHCPEEPFVRLVGDGIWRVSQETDLHRISAKALRDNDVYGGFDRKISESLKNNVDLRNEVILSILNEHFPRSLHSALLDEFGFSLFSVSKKAINRDHKFRKNVLNIYGNKCAVCGYGLALDNIVVGLEAAHIKWFQAGGPCEIENGLCLCSLHHTLFDIGAFTITPKYEIKISNRITQGNTTETFKYDKIFLPKASNYPKGEYLEWHFDEVFKG